MKKEFPPVNDNKPIRKKITNKRHANYFKDEYMALIQWANSEFGKNL